MGYVISNAEFSYYPNGNISHEYYRSTHHYNLQYHRLDGPAFISYFNDGGVESEHYYINDERHRIDGPAFITYFQDGTIKSETYYILNQIHRVDGPAIIYYYENGTIERECYYKNDIDITTGLMEAHYHEADEYTKALIWSMV